MNLLHKIITVVLILSLSAREPLLLFAQERSYCPETEIVLPASVGTIVGSDRTRPHSPTVWIIRDIHGNLDAQKKIAAIIRILLRQKRFPRRLYMENAWGDIPLQWFLEFPDPSAKKTILESCFRKGLITGPETVALNEEFPGLTLVGIDDPILHGIQWQRRREIRVERGRILEDLHSIQEDRSAFKKMSDFEEWRSQTVSFLSLDFGPSDWDQYKNKWNDIRTHKMLGASFPEIYERTKQYYCLTVERNVSLAQNCMREMEKERVPQS
ncbi:MAG: hypothetical protein HYY63_01505, partial [Elusimicrobia bacterium]|nr:hypothetical protein [Elusimicrobiota bacterium]